MAKTPKAKFKLADRPESFPVITVPFKTNRGAEAEIEAVFKYRTREEYGAFVGEFLNVDPADFPKTEEGHIDFQALAKRSTGSDAAYLKGALESWDLDDELGTEALQKMANAHPAAVVALKAAYAAACNEGRLGN